MAKMYLALLMMALCISCSYADNNSTVISNSTVSSIESSTRAQEPIGCICGVFLSGQFKRGSKEQPKGNPALLHDHPDPLPCTTIGNRLCTSKCLDAIVKHLPNGASILCASLDRDVYRERAYLFIKNCRDEWINTHLSAGREYCCRDGLPYKCR